MAKNNILNIGGNYGNTISNISGSTIPVTYKNKFNLSNNGGLPTLIGSGSLYAQGSCGDPDSMCYCPYNGFVYITQHNGSSGGSKIYVLNPKTMTGVAEISAGTSIWGITYCPINNKLYAGEHATGTALYVIDPITNTVSTTISVGGSVYGRDPIYCPTTQKIYYTYNGTTIACINPLTNTIDYTFTDASFVLLNYVRGCFCPINNKIYMDNQFGLIEFDPVSKTFISIPNLTLNYVYGVMFCEETSMIYTLEPLGARLMEISPITKKVTRTLSLPFSYTTHALQYNPNNGFLYLQAYNDNASYSLVVVDLDTFAVVKIEQYGYIYASGNHQLMQLCYVPSTKRVIMATSAAGSSRYHSIT